MAHTVDFDGDGETEMQETHEYLEEELHVIEKKGREGERGEADGNLCEWLSTVEPRIK